MTFAEAQAELQRIVRGINDTATPNDLRQAQRDLDALTDQLRGRAGFDSIRSSIDELYPNLVGSITSGLMAELQRHDAVFRRASDSFAAITSQARRNAGALNLEKAKIVVPALNESLGEIKNILASIKSNDSADAIARGRSLLVLIEKVRDDLAAGQG